MQAELCFEQMEPRIGAVGHSHVALFFHGDGEPVAGEPAPAGHEADLSEGAGCSTRAASASRATATRAPPGCCSTPRAGRPPGAASSTRSTRPRAAIEEAGLPPILADRLYAGQ